MGSPERAPLASELIVLTALAGEAEALLAGAAPFPGAPAPGAFFRRTLASGRTVLVGFTGMGPAVARETARAAVRLGSPLVLAGVGGALRPDLQPGDLVLLEASQRDASSTSRMAFDPALTAELGRVFEAAGLPFRRGESVELASIAGTGEQKRALAARVPGAAVVAMEDLAVLEVAREAGIPCAAFRVVVDRIDDKVPDLTGALDGAGRPRPLHFAAKIARSPTLALALPGLARSFLASRATLDPALEAVLGLA